MMNNSIILWLLFAVAIVAILILYKLGKIQKINIIEWLIYAVTEAEKMLGSGTGELKLRTVYDWFVAKYPLISKFVPFVTFSLWVDIALAKMRELLVNEQIASYVEGITNEDFY